MKITVQQVTRSIHVDVDSRNIVVKKPIQNIQVNQVGRRGATGRNPLTVSATPPPNPQQGDLWYQP